MFSKRFSACLSRCAPCDRLVMIYDSADAPGEHRWLSPPLAPRGRNVASSARPRQRTVYEVQANALPRTGVPILRPISNGRTARRWNPLPTATPTTMDIDPEFRNLGARGWWEPARDSPPTRSWLDVAPLLSSTKLDIIASRFVHRAERRRDAFRSPLLLLLLCPSNLPAL